MFQRSARLQYLLLALVAALSLTHFFLGAKQNFHTQLNGQHIARRPFFGGYTNATISTLMPEARDAGLSIGDTVLTYNGQKFAGNIYLQRELERSSPGQPLAVTYLHPGDSSPHTATIILRPVRDVPTPLWAWIVLTVITTVSFFCLLTGLYVVFARPRNPHAWLILGILAYFNSLFASIPLLTGPLTSIALFWSVIALDAIHRRVLPNPINRYLLNKYSNLTYGKDGALTLYFAAQRPADTPEGNWLPTVGTSLSLTLRFYGPLGGVAEGSYFPPPVVAR